MEAGENQCLTRLKLRRDVKAEKKSLYGYINRKSRQSHLVAVDTDKVEVLSIFFVLIFAS